MILPREIEDIRTQLKEKIAETGAELIEIQYRKVGPKSVITFIADREGGITLEECVEINRRLGAYFDSLSSQIDEPGVTPLQGPYTLEVSSPGLDRPLVSLRDFERALGQTLRVTERETSGNARTYVAKLTSVKDGVLLLELEGAKGTTELTLASVIKAVREIRFRK